MHSNGTLPLPLPLPLTLDDAAAARRVHSLRDCEQKTLERDKVAFTNIVRTIIVGDKYFTPD